MTNSDEINSIRTKLDEITHNLWWTWNPIGRELFRNLDEHLWRKTRHNAIKILQNISDEGLERIITTQKLNKLYNQLVVRYEEYLKVENKWFQSTYHNNDPIAYFSAEYGLHQSLPIYSGGLGVLSGDTTKEASDLGIPLVCIGFLYNEGYFEQRILPDGSQEVNYLELDKSATPLELIKRSDDDNLKIKLFLGEEYITVQAWKLKVGTVDVYLLDTNVEENSSEYRKLTARLYGGDRLTRIRQEIILGMGGFLLLQKLGIKPRMWHLNEGHSSFVGISRILAFIQSGSSFDNALQKVRETTSFTVHTPVPAGHDQFNFELVESKFKHIWEEMGIAKETFLDLGKMYETSDRFNMTVLALNCASRVNGVSRINTEITKKMWKDLLNRLTHITFHNVTNGIHVASWISGPMRRLYTEFIDENWLKNHTTVSWDKIDNIPNDKFWRNHLEAKSRLFHYIRERIRKRHLNSKYSPNQILASGGLLDPNALTIGFARRFATYKRAHLIFKDIDRLRKIINNSYRPVQFIFAGKAHPADKAGQELIKMVYEQAFALENKGRIVFLEDYDMLIGRYMVQGVDVWLNNPIKPKEASGTSGMKTAINGIPNFSVLDGWWVEGYNHNNGWAIQSFEDIEDAEIRNKQEVESLYSILENNIVPMYYDRNEEGIPEKWVSISKNTVKSSITQFSTRRMMKDYVEKMYFI